MRIAEQICEASPQRSVGNLLRAADEVIIAETQRTPSILAKVRPDRIEMEVSGQTRPFVTKQELEARLGLQDRAVLRAHEKSMDSLVRRWTRLHPKVTAAPAGTNNPSVAKLVAELDSVRRALAREFDAALGFIESLGYGLDDHYHAVRHVVAPLKASAGAVSPPREEPTIGARFVLDKQGRPQYSSAESGYWLQAWVSGAPSRTASVVWRMHPTITPAQETIATPPEFRKDFVSYGTFTLRADLRTKRRATMSVLKQDLSQALGQEHPSPRSKVLQEALDEIASN